MNKKEKDILKKKGYKFLSEEDIPRLVKEIKEQEIEIKELEEQIDKYS